MSAFVKPLEWRVPTDHPSDPDRDENVYCADGIGGKYAISKKQKVGSERLLWMADDPFVWVGYNSIPEAKAAAQADYERRVLSALTNTDLSLRAENERLRKIIWDGEAAMWGVHEKGFVMGPLIHRPSIGQIIADLKAKLEEAAKVLEPFADFIAARDDNDPDMPDEAPLLAYVAEFRGEAVRITFKQFRAARSFLSNLKGAE